MKVNINTLKFSINNLNVKNKQSQTVHKNYNISNGKKH